MDNTRIVAFPVYFICLIIIVPTVVGLRCHDGPDCWTDLSMCSECEGMACVRATQIFGDKERVVLTCIPEQLNPHDYPDQCLRKGTGGVHCVCRKHDFCNAGARGGLLCNIQRWIFWTLALCACIHRLIA